MMYRITAILKVETDIIASITIQNWHYCFYRWCHNVFDVSHWPIYFRTTIS